MKNLVIFLCFFPLFLQAQARSPAVEPITGISIEEQEEVSKEQAQGFNFKDTNQATEGERQSHNWPRSILVIFMISLPLAIWFAMMKKLKTPQSTHTHDLPTLQVLKGESSKESQGDDSDDTNYPKAS